MATTKPRTQKRHRKNDLSNEAWSRFLSLLIREEDWEGQKRRVVNGFPVSENASRTVVRWLREGESPTVWKADEYLTAWDLHLDDFFFWCEGEGLCPWALGEAPDWWEAG